MINELNQNLKINGNLEVSDKENTLLGIGAKSPNLFDYKKISSNTMNGITFTNNNDGSFTVSGTATGEAYTDANVVFFTLNRGTYTISRGGGTQGVSVVLKLYDGGVIKYPSTTFTVENDNATVNLYLDVAEGRTIPSGTIVRPMANFGSTLLPFQKYTGDIQHDINQSYSYEEIDTGTTWVNGKKIYKKTGYLARIVAGATATTIVSTGATSVNIIKAEGLAQETSYNNKYPIPFTDPTNQNLWIWEAITSNGVNVKCGTDRDFTNAYMTIYYTKN